MSEQGRDWKEAQEELPGNVLFLTYEMVTWVCSLCEIIPSCKYMIYVLLYMCLDKKTSKTKQKKSTMPKRIVNITAFLLYLFPFNLSLLSLDRILSMFFIKEFVYIMPAPHETVISLKTRITFASSHTTVYILGQKAEQSFNSKSFLWKASKYHLFECMCLCF